MRRHRGQYRHRVILQVLGTPTVGRSGQVTKTWTAVGTYWAFVQPLSGTETENADRLKAKTTHLVTMPFVGSIDASNNRLIFRGRTLNIETALNYDERNREYILTCIEVVNPS